MTPASASASVVSPTALLFARFVVGVLPATRLCGVTDLMDDVDISADERLAFARFFLEASAEDDVLLPDPAEMAELLAIARA